MIDVHVSLYKEGIRVNLGIYSILSDNLASFFVLFPLPPRHSSSHLSSALAPLGSTSPPTPSTQLPITKETSSTLLCSFAVYMYHMLVPPD